MRFLYDTLLNSAANHIMVFCNKREIQLDPFISSLFAKWPIVSDNFYDWDRTKGVMLGDVITTKIDDYVTVDLCVVQEYFGEAYFCIDALAECCRNIQYVEGETIAVKKLFDDKLWENVKNVLIDSFGEDVIDIYVI